MRARCEARRGELEAALAHLGPDGSPSTRKDVKAALAALAALMTGNVERIEPPVALRLAAWLERSKHLALKETRELAAMRPS